MTQKEARCPYCVVAEEFHPMTVLSNRRLICEKCGHSVFPNDAAFRCPCPKCLEITAVQGPRGNHPGKFRGLPCIRKRGASKGAQPEFFPKGPRGPSARKPHDIALPPSVY